MKNFWIVLSSIFIINSYVFAEEITRETVKIQTLKNNPSIAAAKLSLKNAKQEYITSIGAFLPEINFESNALTNNFEKDFSYSHKLEASLNLFSGFGTYSDVKTNALKLKSAQAHYNKIVSDALYKAAAAYIDLIWAYEKVKLLECIKEKKIESKNMIELKYNSGNCNITSLKKEEADTAIVENDLKTAQRYIKTASSNLLEAIGRNDITSVLETNERLDCLEKLPQEPDYDNLIIAMPEFLMAQYNLDSCKIQSLKAKGQWLPSLHLGGEIPLFDNKQIVCKQNMAAKISLSFKIFTGGERYSKTQIASNNLKIASENLKNTANLLKAEAVKYYNSLLDAYELVAVKTQYLSATKLQAEISAKEYVSGLVNYNNWHSIEKDYILAQIELLDAKKSAASKRVHWDTFTEKESQGEII
ncbi:MAG: TolC family protein [Endomicrobium sp.]|nr:TolC family protein [Endomicrobium sp.]